MINQADIDGGLIGVHLIEAVAYHDPSRATELIQALRDTGADVVPVLRYFAELVVAAIEHTGNDPKAFVSEQREHLLRLAAERGTL